MNKHVERFEAISVHAGQASMDKIEALVPVFTYFEGGEIIIDMRMFDEPDDVVKEISEILDVPVNDLMNKFVAVYV